MYEWVSGYVNVTLPLLPVGHGRSALLVRHGVSNLVPTGIGVESFAPVRLIRAWIYLPFMVRGG